MFTHTILDIMLINLLSSSSSSRSCSGSIYYIRFLYLYACFVCISTSSLWFQVDGLHNHKIQSMKFPRFPIKCAKFFKDGRRFVVGSDLYGHFFVYDMEGGKEIKIPWNKSGDRRCMKVCYCRCCFCLLLLVLRFDRRLVRSMDYKQICLFYFFLRPMKS